MRKTIDLGTTVITYDLERKNVKNINLRIKADQSVHVSASPFVPNSVIEAFLRSNAERILRAQERFAKRMQNRPVPRDCTDGERILFFGRICRLSVQTGTRNTVSKYGDEIVLTVRPNTDAAGRKRCLEGWMREQCKEAVEAACATVWPAFREYGVDFPEIRFRKMVSRWGSCRPAEKILTFNAALAEVPAAGIEYVVVHEFTHFLHPNHSRDFYRALAGFLPDWKERRKLLG